MKTLKFKTDIKCSGCVARVSPQLDKIKDITKWSVDILNPEKILTVESENPDASEIMAAVTRAGFKAEQIN